MKTASNLLFAFAALCLVLALSTPVRVIFSGRSLPDDVYTASLALGFCVLPIAGAGVIMRSEIK